MVELMVQTKERLTLAVDLQWFHQKLSQSDQVRKMNWERSTESDESNDGRLDGTEEGVSVGSSLVVSLGFRLGEVDGSTDGTNNGKDDGPIVVTDELVEGTTVGPAVGHELVRPAVKDG